MKTMKYFILIVAIVIIAFAVQDLVRVRYEINETLVDIRNDLSWHPTGLFFREWDSKFGNIHAKWYNKQIIGVSYKILNSKTNEEWRVYSGYLMRPFTSTIMMSK